MHYENTPECLTYGGVGVGVNARGDPIPGVVGVFRGRRIFERLFGPDKPMLEGAEKMGGKCQK